MSNTPASTVQQPEEPTPIQTSALIDEQARKSAMFTVFLVVFIDLLGFGIVLPLLPLYARDLLVPIVPHHLQGVTLGLLMSSFSAMQFPVLPRSGAESPIASAADRFSCWALPAPLSSTPSWHCLGSGGEWLGGLGVSVDLRSAHRGRDGGGDDLHRTGGDCRQHHAGATVAGDGLDRAPHSGSALRAVLFWLRFLFLFLAWRTGLRRRPVLGHRPRSSLSFCCLRRCAAARRRANATGSTGMVCRPSCTILPLAFFILTFFLATLAFGGLESTLAFVNQVLAVPQEELTRERAAETVPIRGKNYGLTLWVFAYVALSSC